MKMKVYTLKVCLDEEARYFTGFRILNISNDSISICTFISKCVYLERVIENFIAKIFSPRLQF
jgi:hypothetical protein